LRVAEGALPGPLMAPTMWIWANSHGSFPLGVVLLAALALGRGLDGERPDRELRSLLWAGAGVLIAVLNPLGFVILRFPLELLSRSDVLRNIVEWQAPGFTSANQRLYLLQIALAVLALVRRPTFRDGVPAVVFIAASLLASRNIAVASLVLIPVTARGLAGLGTITGDRRTPVFSMAAAVLIALGVLFAADAAETPAFELGVYPRAAVAWFGGEDQLERVRTASPDFAGNYLEALFGAKELAFIDDRYDMFPDELSDDYVSLLRARSDWAEVLERRGIEAVIWEENSPLGSVLRESPRWRIAYADDRWLVAVPRTGQP